VVTFWLVAAAIGCKSEDMVEVCGWMFVVLNIFVLAFVFRNLALGIRNVNQEPVRCFLHALPTSVENPVVCALQVSSPLCIGRFIPCLSSCAFSLPEVCGPPSDLLCPGL
jgi:hypothetical protein